MPTWAALQSVIQLGVAINIAIFAIAALREPLVAREDAAMRSLMAEFSRLAIRREVTDDPNWADFKTKFLRAKAGFVEATREIARWDSGLQIIAFFAGVASFVVLVISTYHSNDTASKGWVVAVVVLAALPSGLAVAFNVWLVRRWLEPARRLRSQAEQALAPLANM